MAEHTLFKVSVPETTAGRRLYLQQRKHHCVLDAHNRPLTHNTLHMWLSRGAQKHVYTLQQCYLGPFFFKIQIEWWYQCVETREQCGKGGEPFKDVYTVIQLLCWCLSRRRVYTFFWAPLYVWVIRDHVWECISDSDENNFKKFNVKKNPWK